MESPKIARALISVSDKTGLESFARGLVECGIEILSTGGTAKSLRAAGIDVTDISDFTGFPEVFDGRVKTLHPKVFAGILARRELDSDLQTLKELDFSLIDLIVVNLYPFKETIAQDGVTEQQAIEQIDIGGPSLIRAAAKNSTSVTIATCPEQYTSILSQIQQNGRTSGQLRRELMRDAFKHTAEYDSIIAEYFSAGQDVSGLPNTISLSLNRKCKLRYGENSHQTAAVYSSNLRQGIDLINANQLHGKELSYNNFLDLDSAISIVGGFADVGCCVIKHNNPCGAAASDSQLSACEKAFACDPLSAFGSIVGFNREVDAATAQFLAEGQFFVEAIIAPSFHGEAFDILTTKPKWKANVRLVEIGSLENDVVGIELRQVRGGFLVQQQDPPDNIESWKTVTESSPSSDQRRQLEFAWAVVRHVKSNAIVLAKNDATCGIGAGQMSRVDSVEISISKAGDKAKGSVLASDAFFPFPDSIERAAEAGISAIVQPGGSVKDEEVIAACNRLEIPMIFTGRRHFKH